MHNRIFNQLLSLCVIGAFSYLNLNAMESSKDLRAEAARIRREVDPGLQGFALGRLERASGAADQAEGAKTAMLVKSAVIKLPTGASKTVIAGASAGKVTGDAKAVIDDKSGPIEFQMALVTADHKDSVSDRTGLCAWLSGCCRNCGECVSSDYSDHHDTGEDHE